MNELSSAISALQRSSKALNTISDSIAKKISQIESILNDTFSVGVQAVVTIKEENVYPNDDYHEAPTRVETTLHYGRFDGKFQFYVMHTADGDWETASSKKWSECSREQKIEAATKLPELMAAIGTLVQEKIDKAASAEAAVDSVLSGLNAGSGTSAEDLF